MKKFLFIALILLGVGILSSCEKIGGDTLIGTWKVASSADAMFDGGKVGSILLGSASPSNLEADAELLSETLSFNKVSVDISAGAESYNLVYSYENGEIILSAFTRSIRWKVAKLSSSELVIMVGLEKLKDNGYFFVDTFEDEAKKLGSTSFKGKTIYTALPESGIARMSDWDKVRFYYIDSKGNRVPCCLVNLSIRDAFGGGENNGDSMYLKDNLTFATSFQVRYTKQ